MSEGFHQTAPENLVPAEPTGNAAVDRVLESLEQLDGAAVTEHAPVFESAHEQLRAALADAGNDATGS